MITKITINNFKKIEHISFDLSSPLVLIGPNNSGKTSILQAITLWETGLKKWANQKSTQKSKTITINRKDLISLPIPSAKLLWHNLKTHDAKKVAGKQDTKNVYLDIIIEGNNDGKNWSAAFEFNYANEESLYCRPLRKGDENKERYEISPESYKTRVAYLQPMSGLASSEDRLTAGSIDRKIGEGKTADVIRNISYQLLHPERAIDAATDQEIKGRWDKIASIIKDKFGILIQEPTFNPENGLLEMKYIESGISYDLSSAGRGFQQTLLLLCFLYSNPGKIVLLDEPDAHLEVLRQKEIYHLISEITRSLGSQLIIASHSEIVLNQAASKDDDIIAILESSAIKLNDQRVRDNFKKSLTDFGWDKYYLARLKKHCIYLEGTTDALNLETFARKLNHPTANLIGEANIDPVETNLPKEAFKRFQAIKLIDPEIKGLCLFDRIDRESNPDDPLTVLQWRKRELENYFCKPEILLRWADSKAHSLFTGNYREIMENCIRDLTAPQFFNDPNAEWWDNEKLGDWAEMILKEFSKRTNQPMVLRKGTFYELIAFLKIEEIDLEITEKLDAIYQVIKPE
jgi:ABC-type cobalamin/Fe3+-siderophores transport system ATPase subunit